MTQYVVRLHELTEGGKPCGEACSDPGGEAAAPFIGTIQGFVVQGLIRGGMGHMTEAVAGMLAIYRDGIDAGGAGQRGA